MQMTDFTLPSEVNKRDSNIHLSLLLQSFDDDLIISYDLLLLNMYHFIILPFL